LNSEEDGTKQNQTNSDNTTGKSKEEYNEEITLGLAAQVLFCLLIPNKITFSMCHNDLKLDNIMFDSTNTEYLYVKLKKCTMIRETILKIPTWGYKCTLIDYAFSSFDLYDGSDKIRIESMMHHFTKLKMNVNNTFTDLVQLCYSMIRHTNKKLQQCESVFRRLVSVSSGGKIDPSLSPNGDQNIWFESFYNTSSNECTWNKNTMSIFFLYFINKYKTSETECTIFKTYDLDALFVW
jgi:hypothetical protein